MKEVLYYNVFSVPNVIETNRELVAPYLSKDYSDSLFSLYRKYKMDAVNVVYDRTNKTPHYINFKKDLFPIPDYVGFNKDFSQIVEERAKELLILNKQINVVWSGGIDSTLALFALIKFCNDPSQITVYGTYNSILESGNLFEKYILPRGVRYRITPSSQKEFKDPDAIYVTGFMGNQLFGPTDDFSKNSTITLFHHQFNSIDVDDPYETCVHPELLDFLLPSIKASPRKIETVRDLRWFLIFNFDWYTGKFDAMVTTDNRDKVYHFFETDDFQRYAVTTKEPFTKVKGNSLTHRWVMRELIEEYSGDSYYAWNKPKGISNLSNKNPSWLFLLENYELVVDKSNHHV
jgi:hypothetical protein